MGMLPRHIEQTIDVPKSLYVRFGKQMLDLMLCLLLALPVLAVCAVVSVLIKLDSKGPVLFRQPRFGKDGREFQIYKFRTMYIDAPRQGRSPVSDRDPRITRIGRLLRKTSIDELPQLINVLRGEMSFVGPRPEQSSIVQKYYTGYERQRFLVKPGITGLWQISMDRTKPIHENLSYDLQYIREMSLGLDLWIILQTVLIVCKSNTC
ncbi:sugar transferase [Brevibacillus sp. B_LB10_24]|uniref:sugar transferase n=1 Tax=Brevibacillus sp. B_LB10_24 TaxID=3380645 RepID=UPI0038BA2198